MSAIRYSGAVRIRVTYIDPKAGEVGNGNYRCHLVCGKDRATVYVGAVVVHGSGIGVDSPESFDDAAHAALSFATDASAEESERIDCADKAAYAIDLSGWHVGRSPETAWPKEEVA